MARMLGESPYQGYVYGYPHKSAYRSLPGPVPLAPLWQAQDRSALFYYVHIPFCEMRCGFCNLFTRANPREAMVADYLAALGRHMETMGEILSDSGCGGFALGGGTPTYLAPDELARVLDDARRFLGVTPASVPSSAESSPATATPERLAVLRDAGVERLSIGIQSFHEHETARSGRRQAETEVHAALSAIRDAGFPVLNTDLIYGIEGQTVASWLSSIAKLLEYRPEESYLYPLYVRPLTGLGRQARAWDDQRLELYRAGRDFLLANGYRQVSMRMFRRTDLPAGRTAGYRCQQDGMVGVGCGARSYTRHLHYSHEYAVSGKAVQAIITAYSRLERGEFAVARHGMLLDDNERRRRYLLQSLLQAEGVRREDYRAQFGDFPENHFGELNMLADGGLAVLIDGNWRLTPAGLERSDAVGPWLYSEPVRRLMGAGEAG